MDMQDLEAKLKEAQKHRLRLVATDGAFSMDGDIAPLREICQLAQKYDALVFIDECHATGFLGPNGRGTDELLGVMDKVTIINSTLGKALGGAAGEGIFLSRVLHAVKSSTVDTQQVPNPSSICSASVPVRTSSPTACPLPWWAVHPRPWTCSWRAMPLHSLWLPKPNGEGAILGWEQGQLC
ncbi:hypothetical protein Nmel_005422 [Mimus melanotis]